MGGKKKLTISQAEKAQLREAQKEEGKKSKTSQTSRTEKKIAGVIPPNPKDEKIIKEIQKMKVLTPYIIASRFNLRLSVARDFLEDLCKYGVIARVSSGVNTEIYKPL
jgi:small subunit ribosomal protein S25e